jgi:DNA-binding transcriptional regulator YhcF (GntR family)
MSSSFRTDRDLDTDIRRVVYDQFLSHGSAISMRQVADELSLNMEDVGASYQRLADAHVLVLQPGSGEVLMANPFSAVPTSFRVVAAGGE